MMQTLGIVAIVVIVILSIAAVKTVIPNEKASKPCLLGYKAACSFTPISTIILIVAAVGTFILTKGVILG
jgi:hypothetical protein